MMPLSRALMLSVGILLVAADQAAAQGVLVDKSEIRFVSKQMGVKAEGRFRKWKANVVFSPGALATSKAEIDVDLASIDLASSESEAEARGQPWFDTARFAVAHFASTSVKDRGGDRYDIAGQLTIKGVTRDCVVPITVKNDAAGNRVVEGIFIVKRLDYKIGEGLWADTDTVANEVDVAVRIVLPPQK
jgi:polyisoprenoid-binding protein YceI